VGWRIKIIAGIPAEPGQNAALQTPVAAGVLRMSAVVQEVFAPLADLQPAQIPVATRVLVHGIAVVLYVRHMGIIVWEAQQVLLFLMVVAAPVSVMPVPLRVLPYVLEVGGILVLQVIMVLRLFLILMVAAVRAPVIAI